MKVAEKLSKTLFWDVDIKKLDNEKSKHFIIGRVLDFGTLEDWKIIKDFYGITTIKEVAEGHNFSSKKNINFWSTILNFSKSKWSQSQRKPSMFWKC